MPLSCTSDDEDDPTSTIDQDDIDLRITRDEVDDLFKETIETCAGTHPTAGADLSSSPPNWVTGSHTGVFSVDQIETLKMQLAQNFQLCLQSYCIERQLNGVDSTNCKFWDCQLAQQKFLCDTSTATLGPDTLFNTPGISLIPRVQEAEFDHESEQAVQFIADYQTSVQLKAKEKYIEAAKRSSAQDKSRPRAASKAVMAVFPDTLVSVLSLFDKLFDPELKPSIISVSRSHMVSFSADEDQLMYLGFSDYGFSDIPTVRAHYLPTKTHNQIKYRFKNLVHRGRGTNPIKELYLQPFPSLRVAEKHLLLQGARKFGCVFKGLSWTVFAQRPDALIQMAWDGLVRIGEIARPWDSITDEDLAVLMEPTDDGGGGGKGFGLGGMTDGESRKRNGAPLSRVPTKVLKRQRRGGNGSSSSNVQAGTASHTTVRAIPTAAMMPWNGVSARSIPYPGQLSAWSNDFAAALADHPSNPLNMFKVAAAAFAAAASANATVNATANAPSAASDMPMTPATPATPGVPPTPGKGPSLQGTTQTPGVAGLFDAQNANAASWATAIAAQMPMAMAMGDATRPPDAQQQQQSYAAALAAAGAAMFAIMAGGGGGAAHGLFGQPPRPSPYVLLMPPRSTVGSATSQQRGSRSSSGRSMSRGQKSTPFGSSAMTAHPVVAPSGSQYGVSDAGAKSQSSKSMAAGNGGRSAVFNGRSWVPAASSASAAPTTALRTAVSTSATGSATALPATAAPKTTTMTRTLAGSTSTVRKRHGALLAAVAQPLPSSDAGYLASVQSSDPDVHTPPALCGVSEPRGMEQLRGSPLATTVHASVDAGAGVEAGMGAAKADSDADTVMDVFNHHASSHRLAHLGSNSNSNSLQYLHQQGGSRVQGTSKLCETIVVGLGTSGTHSGASSSQTDDADVPNWNSDFDTDFEASSSQPVMSTSSGRAGRRGSVSSVASNESVYGGGSHGDAGIPPPPPPPRVAFSGLYDCGTDSEGDDDEDDEPGMGRRPPAVAASATGGSGSRSGIGMRDTVLPMKPLQPPQPQQPAPIMTMFAGGRGGDTGGSITLRGVGRAGSRRRRVHKETDVAASRSYGETDAMARRKGGDNAASAAVAAASGGEGSFGVQVKRSKRGILTPMASDFA
ncbi:hypothetical protein BC831DRAFT_12992 [Entophlyctis helioformis]|nr:hypothetical protein BC831DRAFT_12992 [Entophlyctis helioformis]